MGFVLREYLFAKALAGVETKHEAIGLDMVVGTDCPYLFPESKEDSRVEVLIRKVGRGVSSPVREV